MTTHSEDSWDARSSGHRTRGFAVILGTNEIASAAGVYLHRAGWGVVLCHNPTPVIRRRMAFYDAVFGDAALVDGVKGVYADQAAAIRTIIQRPGEVAVTRRDFLDVLVIQKMDVLVDARMQKYKPKSDIRWLAGVSLGLGPGFEAGVNCDIAIETHPGNTGAILYSGRTADPDRQPALLGGAGRERFIYTTAPGRWHTPIEIGARVFKDFVLGHLEGLPVRSPFDGIVRGIARDGLQMPGGIKLLEIDPRQRRAKWTGIDQRGHAIAKAAVTAVRDRIRQHILSD